MRYFDIYKNMFKNQAEDTNTCLHNEWNQHLGMKISTHFSKHY
jgi:hypothetical protein